MPLQQSTLDFPVRKTRSNTKYEMKYKSLQTVNCQNKDVTDFDIKRLSPYKRRENDSSELENGKSPSKTRKMTLNRSCKENIDIVENQTHISPLKKSLGQRTPLKSVTSLSRTPRTPLTPLKNLTLTANTACKDDCNTLTTPTKNVDPFSPCKRSVAVAEHLSSPVRRSPRKLNFTAPSLVSSSSRTAEPTGCYVSSMNRNNFDIKRLSPYKRRENDSSELENGKSPSKTRKMTLNRSCKENIDIVENQTHISPLKKSLGQRTPLKSVTSLSRTPRTPLTPLKNLTLTANTACKDDCNTLTTPTKNVDPFSPCKRSVAVAEHLSSPVRRSPRKLNFTAPSLVSSSSRTAEPTGCYVSSMNRNIKLYKSLRSTFASSSNGKLVGREKQAKELENYLQEHVQNCSPGSLYISGAPGTGKTATVTKIIEDFKATNVKKVFLNCMSKKSSKEIFLEICQNFTKKCGRTEREIIANIERCITTFKIPILIVLDEIDQLESQHQNVLYTLFEWPSLQNSKLILIGIANMLDLTDRVLPRLHSNMSYKPQLLHFSSYTKTEIVDIINERIKEAGVSDVQIIKPSAVHFLAGKVAAVAGDVRKALDVCRRSVELSELEMKKQSRLCNAGTSAVSPTKEAVALKQVDIPQVLTIFNEIYGSRVTSEIVDNPSLFPLQQKVLICSLLLMLKHSKSKNISLGKFQEIYCRVCQHQKLPFVEQSEFFSLCTLLESRGMLQVKKSKELRSSKVILRLNEEEAEQALGDKVLLANILKDRSCLSK